MDEMNRIEELRREIDNLNCEIDRLKNENDELSKQIDDLNREFDDLKSENDELSEKNKDIPDFTEYQRLYDCLLAASIHKTEKFDDVVHLLREISGIYFYNSQELKNLGL